MASPLSSYSRSPAILSVEDIGNGSRSCSCAAGPERPAPQETCGGVINVSDLDWSNHLFSRVLDPRRSSSRALNPRFQLTTSRPLYANPSQTSKTCITVIHLWSRRENTNSANARQNLGISPAAGEGKGREGKGTGKGSEGREGKGREGKGREGRDFTGRPCTSSS